VAAIAPDQLSAEELERLAAVRTTKDA
jgi:hypothetical protein